MKRLVLRLGTSISRVTMATMATGALIVWWLVRHGPDQFLDAASYRAAADSFAHGHGFTTTLAPVFSQFSAADFVSRGGRIPFSDFPLGYQVVTGIIALATGARRALLVVTIAASAATVGIVAARGRHLSIVRQSLLGVVGLALVVMPTHLATVRAGLSEPLFVALLLGAASCSVSAQADGANAPKWLRRSLVLAGLAALVRFVGLPTLLVPGVLLSRQVGRRRASLLVVLAAAPAAGNAIWSAAVGGGHRVAWRGAHLSDLHIAAHSVSGWFVRGDGGFTSLFAGGSWPAWYGVVLFLAWAALSGVAVLAVVRGTRWLPAPVQVCTAFAAMVTLAIVAGMWWFDSLVTPDNRLLLPVGALVLAGLAWWLVERVPAAPAAVTAALWIALAVHPWDLRPAPEPTENADLVRAVAGARLVISDDADQVWWTTQAPAAYLPPRTRLLTDEVVDREAELAALPCQLHTHDGVVVLVGGAFADQSLRTMLDELVVAGSLRAAEFGTVVRYSPTGSGCSAG